MVLRRTMSRCRHENRTNYFLFSSTISRQSFKLLATSKQSRSQLFVFSGALCARRARLVMSVRSIYIYSDREK